MKISELTPAAPLSGNESIPITQGGVTVKTTVDQLKAAVDNTIILTGDITGSGTDSLSTTLASVGTPGTYKSVTTDAKGRVTAGTNPTTLAGYGITDAAPLNFTQAGTGAISRSIDLKLKDAVSAFDFVPPAEIAAIQNYSSTYDATAAINAALATGKQVHLPAGLWNVHPNVGIILPTGFSIVGDGMMRTIIKALPFGGTVAELTSYIKGSVIKRAFTVGAANAYVSFGYLADFSVILVHPPYNAVNYRQIAIDLRNITRSTVERVYCGNFANPNIGHPITLTVSNTNATQGYGFVLGTQTGGIDYSGGEVNTLRNCHSWGLYKNIVLDDSIISPQSSCHGTLIDNCDVQGGHELITQGSQYNAGSIIKNVTIQGNFRQSGNTNSTIGISMSGYNCSAHVKYAEMGTNCDKLFEFTASAHNCTADLLYYSSSAPSTATITDTGVENHLTYPAPEVSGAITNGFGTLVETFNQVNIVPLPKTGGVLSGDLQMAGTTQTIFSNNFSAVSGSAPMTILNNEATIFKKTAAGGGNEFFRIANTGAIGIGGTNYGTTGQVLTSAGPSASPTWTGLNFTQSGSGAVARTIDSKLKDEVNVFDFMTAAQIADVKARTHLIDVTAAMQAAITAVGTMGILYCPPGYYRITSELVISQERFHLRGAGGWATVFYFAPTANGACLRLSAGTNILHQGSVTGIAFWSDDETYTKTAIDMYDTSGYLIDDIIFSGAALLPGVARFWGGANSIGIRTRGREACKISRIYGFADRPIVISVNPNHSISIDHFHFQDLLLAARNNPHVTMETGVNFTQVTFDGYQAWVLGNYGFYCQDNTTVGESNGLHFHNVRLEQSLDENAYSFYISRQYYAGSVTFNNCYANNDRKGVYLRNVRDVAFTGHNHIAANEALNIDSTVHRVSARNCFWQALSTALMPGHRFVSASPKNPSNGALPPNFITNQSTSNTRNAESDETISSPSITLAVDAVAQVGISGSTGFLFITTSEGFSAIFSLNGTANSVAEISDPTGFFTPTVNNANTFNVYWSAANSQYEVQNKRGAVTRIKTKLIGSFINI